MKLLTRQAQHLKQYTARLVALLTVPILMLGGLTHMAHATTIPVGLYSGPGMVSSVNNFSSWLGTPVTYATDYVDYKNGWSTDFNPTWLIGPWGQWVKAAPGRRLVLGLPLLENSDYGQFDLATSGAFDSYFYSLGQQMVQNNLGNSIIRLGYEANYDQIGPWQATDNPSGYIREFRHIVQLMRSVPGSSFSFDWNVAGGLQGGHVLDSFASFYPGDDVVDIMGIDQYDMKWGDPSVTPEQRWQWNVTRYMGLQDQRNFAALHNKPVSFPEWALYQSGDQFAGGGDDPYFIDQMADWMASGNTAYQSYFNLNWGGGTLASFPNGQAEYKVRFGQPAPAPDTTAPQVTISSPLNNALTGSKITVSASATDNVQVVKMELYVDGSLKKSVTSSTLSSGVGFRKKGAHTISVKAYDAAGNSSMATVTITSS